MAYARDVSIIVTTRQETLRDNLKSGKDIYRRIEALKAYMTINEAILTGTGNPELKKEIADQNAELEREYNSLILTRKKIDKCIDAIDDSELKSIMISRYLGHKNTLQIAEQMNYGRNTINRKHKKALQIIINKGYDNIFFDKN